MKRELWQRGELGREIVWVVFRSRKFSMLWHLMAVKSTPLAPPKSPAVRACLPHHQLRLPQLEWFGRETSPHLITWTLDRYQSAWIRTQSFKYTDEIARSLLGPQNGEFRLISESWKTLPARNRLGGYHLRPLLTYCSHNLSVPISLPSGPLWLLLSHSQTLLLRQPSDTMSPRLKQLPVPKHS